VPRTCPICKKPVAPREANRAFPFCSDRCRLVDLAKWVGEEYRIPGPRPGDGGGPEADPARPDRGEEDDA
jgi:uncharacterized protein